MKTNGEMNHGGKLKEEYYDAWTRLIVKYVQAYEQEGIVVSRLTLQNEPAATQTWDSCIFSAEDERRFACGYLRKRLDEAGYDSVKLNIWDHNKDRILERTGDTFIDEETDKAIQGIHFTGIPEIILRRCRQCVNDIPRRSLSLRKAVWNIPDSLTARPWILQSSMIMR